MKKPRRKLTAAERKAKKRRKEQYETVFLNGRQVRIRRPPTVDGIPLEEFLRNNADPLWLHANEMWEYIETPPPLAPAALHVPDAPPNPDRFRSENRYQRQDHGPPEWDETIPF